MQALRINLLGPLEVLSGDDPLPSFPTARSRRLFAFLALHRGKSFCRERLADQLREEVPQAVASQRFRNTVWRMRSVVEPAGVPRGTYFSDRARTLGIDPDAECSTDVEEFERLLAPSLEPHGCDAGAPVCVSVDRALALYRGDLCEGDDDGWCMSDRERLRALYLSALRRAASCCATHGRWAGAIAWTERALRNDPLHEQVHRDLIRYYYFAGDRPAALAQFARLCSLLAAELQVEPMRETLDLVALVRSGGKLAVA